MEKRVEFTDENSRKLFFDEVYISYNADFWKNIYLNLSIPKSVFEKYKSGNLTLPYQIYSNLTSKFAPKKQKMFSGRINILNSNWGSVKGGKATYYKNKNLFDKGREKAIKIVKEKSVHFDINLPLNEDLAYFISLFVGDGFTNKYRHSYMFQFVGHKKELSFYKNEIVPISKKLFNIIPYIKSDLNGNFIRVNFYSSCLFKLTTERFKIKRGEKSRTVLIPEEILKGNRRYLLAFIAGVYDAECCIFFDKRGKYPKPYPRIDLHMVNPDLIKQISSILNEEFIQHGINGDYERILIYGEKNISNFLRKIPLKNSKNLNKLKEQNLI